MFYIYFIEIYFVDHVPYRYSNSDYVTTNK